MNLKSALFSAVVALTFTVAWAATKSIYWLA